MTEPKFLIVEHEMLIARELEARLMDLGYAVVRIGPVADVDVREIDSRRAELDHDSPLPLS